MGRSRGGGGGAGPGGRDESEWEVVVGGTREDWST